MIQPLVSQQRFGSIQEENCGSLNLSINYEPDLGLLTVRLMRAQDLVVPAACQGRSTVDPYCRLCLLPNRRHRLHSVVHTNTVNPEFDEEFVFDATRSEMTDRTLEILFFDACQSPSSKVVEHPCLGQVLVHLDELNLSERLWMLKGISAYEEKREVGGWSNVLS